MLVACCFPGFLYARSSLYRGIVEFETAGLEAAPTGNFDQPRLKNLRAGAEASEKWIAQRCIISSSSRYFLHKNGHKYSYGGTARHNARNLGETDRLSLKFSSVSFISIDISALCLMLCVERLNHGWPGRFLLVGLSSTILILSRIKVIILFLPSFVTSSEAVDD